MYTTTREIGLESEMLVKTILNNIFSIKSELQHPTKEYDLITENGIKIEVKRATFDKSTTSWKVFFSEGKYKNGKEKYVGKYKKKNNSIHYKKSNRFYKDYTKSCDFIICHIQKLDIFYIIPSKCQDGIGRFNLIPKSKISKYDTYKNDWKQLTNKCL